MYTTHVRMYVTPTKQNHLLEPENSEFTWIKTGFHTLQETDLGFSIQSGLCQFCELSIKTVISLLSSFTYAKDCVLGNY